MAPVEFLQLSAQVPQHFAEGFSSDDKLAGMSLNRFGAFLKRSWRANDWIWGRLDAIKLLMQLLITPEVIRDVAKTMTQSWPSDDAEAAEILNVVLQTVFQQGGDGVREINRDPEIRKLRNSAREEVKGALSGSNVTLTATASLAAYALQIEVAAEEVPWLAGTIRDDQDNGATGVESARFVRRYDKVAKAEGEPTTATEKLFLLKTFAESGIGQEAITSQLPSDLIIRTGATATASAATALSSDRAGLGIARPAARAFRGVAAVPYWALTGLTHRGQLARMVAASVLALGVALIAVSLVVPLPGLLSPLISTLGIASLITVFAYAALRTQSIVHGAALLALLVPLVAVAAARIVIQVEKAEGSDPTGSVPEGPDRHGDMRCRADHLGDDRGQYRAGDPAPQCRDQAERKGTLEASHRGRSHRGHYGCADRAAVADRARCAVCRVDVVHPQFAVERPVAFTCRRRPRRHRGLGHVPRR